MRPAPGRNVSGLIVWGTLLVVLMAAPIWTAYPAGQLPPTTPTAVSHEPWHSVRQGHADLAPGVFFREDADLVVNTPCPIVLRRTCNSADGHSRQFGADAAHPGDWRIDGKGSPAASARRPPVR